MITPPGFDGSISGGHEQSCALCLGAGEEDAGGEGDMAERATRLSDSGGSRDMEDGGDEASDEAMRAMLGAQEYHEVPFFSLLLLM